MKRYVLGAFACAIAFGCGALLKTQWPAGDAIAATKSLPANDSPLPDSSNRWEEAVAEVAEAASQEMRRDPVPFAASQLAQVEPQTLRFDSAPLQVQAVRNNARFDTPHESFNGGLPVDPQFEQTIESVNVTEGMSYALHISRKPTDALPRHATETRVIGNTRVSFTTSPNIFSPLRIFAESVELTNDENDFQLQCKGKVTIVAAQSMLRGEGLVYSDGTFKISSPEITTPDTQIQSDNSSFEYPIGAVTVSALAAPAAEAIPAGPPAVNQGGATSPGIFRAEPRPTAPPTFDAAPEPTAPPTF